MVPDVDVGGGGDGDFVEAAVDEGEVELYVYGVVVGGAVDVVHEGQEGVVVGGVEEHPRRGREVDVVVH